MKKTLFSFLLSLGLFGIVSAAQDEPLQVLDTYVGSASIAFDVERITLEEGQQYAISCTVDGTDVTQVNFREDVTGDATSIQLMAAPLDPGTTYRCTASVAAGDADGILEYIHASQEKTLTTTGETVVTDSMTKDMEILSSTLDSTDLSLTTTAVTVEDGYGYGLICENISVEEGGSEYFATKVNAYQDVPSNGVEEVSFEVELSTGAEYKCYTAVAFQNESGTSYTRHSDPEYFMTEGDPIVLEEPKDYAETITIVDSTLDGKMLTLTIAPVDLEEGQGYGLICENVSVEEFSSEYGATIVHAYEDTPEDPDADIVFETELIADDAEYKCYAAVTHENNSGIGYTRHSEWEYFTTPVVDETDTEGSETETDDDTGTEEGNDAEGTDGEETAEETGAEDDDTITEEERTEEESDEMSGDDAADEDEAEEEGETTPSFSDVSEVNEYFTEIEYVKTRGIVKGFDDGTYRAGNEITRAEFMKILLLAQYTQEEVDACTTDSFSDVSADAWYYNYLCFAKENGIVKGYPDGSFLPNNSITFAEAAKITVNTLGGEVLAEEGARWWALHEAKLRSINAVPATISEESAAAHKLTRGEMAYIIYQWDNR